MSRTEKMKDKSIVLWYCEHAPKWLRNLVHGEVQVHMEDKGLPERVVTAGFKPNARVVALIEENFGQIYSATEQAMVAMYSVTGDLEDLSPKERVERIEMRGDALVLKAVANSAVEPVDKITATLRPECNYIIMAL